MLEVKDLHVNYGAVHALNGYRCMWMTARSYP